MKKSRLFCLLILIILTCTGCSVEYNINITRNNIEEVVNVTDYMSENRTRNDIMAQYNLWYPTFVNYVTYGETIELENFNEKVDGIEYHSKSIEQIGNGYKYTYKYTYDIDDYYDSYLLASTFYETTILKRSNSLVLKTSEESFLCKYDYYDDAIINITIDPEFYKLNYTNAEEVNKNTYTWFLDRSDCDNSEIILTLDKINNSGLASNNSSSGQSTGDNKIDNLNADDYGIYILFAIIAILILIGYVWFNKLKQKNNDID